MNIVALWGITGATTDRRQRTVVLAFWAGMTVLTLAFARSVDLVVPLIAYSIGMGFWWAFVAGRALLLQRDARLLLLPEIDAMVAANLLLQFGLTALLPALVMTVATGAEFLRMAALFSCIAAGALMFQMLPRALAMLFSIVPAAMQLLHARGAIPGLGDPAFIPFGWTLAAAMLFVALWRWRVILAADADSFGGWNVPLVIQMQRRTGRCENLDGVGADAKAASGSMWAGLHRQVMLDGIGPHTPTRTLRVWLGGTFAPIGWRGRMTQIAFALLPMSVPVLFHWITGGTIEGWTVFAIVAVGAIVPLVTMSVAPARLARLRSDAGGEIAQLALLPGLGGPEAKRNLLRAALGVPVCACACVYGFSLAACLAAGGSAFLMAALTLATMGAVAFGVIQAMTVVAGRAIPRSALHAAFVLSVTLLCVTPVFLPPADSAGLDRAADLVLLGWGMLYTLLAWLGLRASRTLASRPHAFLLDD